MLLIIRDEYINLDHVWRFLQVHNSLHIFIVGTNEPYEIKLKWLTDDQKEALRRYLKNKESEFFNAS
jgi:hypothetical protein